MLDKLFSSGTRTKLLELFLLNKGREYYLRELEKLLGENSNSLLRELNNLSALGVLERRRQGNLVLYTVNERLSIYPELRGLFLKTGTLVSTLSHMLEGKGLRLAFIYGSFAEGKERLDSDIDVFLVGDVRDEALAGSFSGLERRAGRQINYILYPPEEFLSKKSKTPFLVEVLKRKKVVLFDKDGYLSA